MNKFFQDLDARSRRSLADKLETNGRSLTHLALMRSSRAASSQVMECDGGCGGEEGGALDLDESDRGGDVPINGGGGADTGSAADSGGL